MTRIKNSLKKIKYSLFRMNAKGKINWIWKVFKYMENLIKFHSFKRLINFINFFFLFKLKGYKRLKIEKIINQGVFYINLVKGKGEIFVLKIPRFTNHHSNELLKALKRKDSFIRYKSLLNNLSNDSIIGHNFPKVQYVRRDGGYMSSFITGYNMGIVRELLRRDQPLPNDIEIEKLINSISVLLNNLRKYKNREGELKGDWAPHNLIYDPLENRIINVDLEGMYIYDSNRIESNLHYISGELESIKNVITLRNSDSKKSKEILDVLSILSYSIRPDIAYSGRLYFAGYHTISLNNYQFIGQRECKSRLDNIPYEFKDKIVLDIGCNTGGMLHSIAKDIKIGVGIDSDPRSVNAANLISRFNKINNLGFFTFNLEKENLNLIKKFFLENKVDICFLLSVLMWVKNGESIIKFVSQITKHLLFETNGSSIQQKEQEEWAAKYFNNVQLLNIESEDDPIQKKRRLYLCKR